MEQQLIILGSGPAGYTAAVYAARANLKPLLITGLEVGGQLTTTTEVENWPGDFEDLQGPDLMVRMQKHAEKYDVDIRTDYVKSVDLSNQPLILQGEKDTYKTKSLIIATGASAKYLGLESEKAFLGKGVSACATCDGFFYKDQEVAVVGGGNTALEEALYLSNICSKVYLIHRRDEFRGAQSTVNKIFELAKAGKINLLTKYQISNVKGTDKLESIEVKHDNSETKILETDFVLGFFGLIMQLGPIANWGLNIDKKTIEVDTEKFETNQKGIYAVGDICSYPGKLKLILSGFHEGALAARACFKLARPNEKYRFEFTTSSKKIKDRLGIKSD